MTDRETETFHMRIGLGVLCIAFMAWLSITILIYEPAGEGYPGMIFAGIFGAIATLAMIAVMIAEIYLTIKEK